MGCRLNSRTRIIRRIQLLLELSELTGSEKIFARARTGIGRELAITKRRLSNTTNFRFWLCVDGPGLARVVLTVVQVGRVQLCVRPYMRRALSRLCGRRRSKQLNQG